MINAVVKCADSLYQWLKTCNLKVFRTDSRKSIYIEVELNDKTYMIRISDHSAELSHYHWGNKVQQIDIDIVLGKSKDNGGVYADANSLSAGAQIIAKELNVFLPAKYKNKPKPKPIKRKQIPSPTLEYYIIPYKQFFILTVKVKRHTGTIQRKIERHYLTIKNAERGMLSIHKKYGMKCKVKKIKFY